MYKMNKKAGTKMVVGQTIKLILGLAVVIVLALLVYSLIAPYFDKQKETAESYLKTLKEEMVGWVGVGWLMGLGRMGVGWQI